MSSASLLCEERLLNFPHLGVAPRPLFQKRRKPNNPVKRGSLLTLKRGVTYSLSLSVPLVTSVACIWTQETSKEESRPRFLEQKLRE